MKTLLLALLVTYVSANVEIPQLQAVEVIKEDEQMAEQTMLQMLRDHEDDHEMKNIFDLLAPGLEAFFKGLHNMTDEDMGLDASSTTGFNKEISDVMWMVYGDMCEQGEECNSPFMGCNCHGYFNKLENPTCRKFPCSLAQWAAHGSAAKLFRNIRVQKDLKGLIGAVMESVHPLMKMACQCNPELFSTAVSCAKNYDGKLIEGRKDWKAYKKSMRKIKFDSMIEVAYVMFGAYCGNKEGVCLGSFQNLAEEFASMMDRSCAGETEDQCNNFRRLSGGIWEFIIFMSDETREKTMKSIVKNFYRFVPKEFWCGNTSCAAGYLSKYFNNNCCFRDAVEKFNVGMVGEAEKYIRSLLRAVSGGEIKIPGFGKMVRTKISQSVNPNRACKSMYYEAADKCEDLGAF